MPSLTLHNLSTCEDCFCLALPAEAVKPLISLLKDSKKHSKFAEKAACVLEILSRADGGRNSLLEIDGGIRTLVDTVKDGSLLSSQHAVGALLSLCGSCRQKYWELILKEGPIPGLLLLTVEGMDAGQAKAQDLLDLLRDRPRRSTVDFRDIAHGIATGVNGLARATSTRRLLEHEVI